MRITDKDGFGWALGDCSDIGLAHELLEEDDNTYYVGIQLKSDRGFSQIPFATKEEAESALKQIDAAMTAARNHWNPAHNVPPLFNPHVPVKGHIPVEIYNKKS